MLSRSNQPESPLPNIGINIEDVIMDKVFLNTLKYAESETKFRVLFELSDSRFLPLLSHMGKKLNSFETYSGLALTLSKTNILKLIEKQIIKNLWFNSIVYATSDSSNFQALNLTREVYDYTTSIGAPSLWIDGFFGNSTKIAILDTGIKENHPALNQTMEGDNKILARKNFFDDTTNVQDDNGHGTELAGIIGSNGLFGFDRGIAPNCEFLIGKVLSDEGQGTVETLIDGIDWAIEKEADIINLSLGKAFSNISSPEVVAVNTAVQQGVVVCVAAGNVRNTNEFGYNDLFTILSPGTANLAITVGALDNNKIIYEKSSAGSAVINYDDLFSRFLFDSVDISNTLLKPDLLAPGVLLNTTSKDGLTTKRVSGTSYATGVVSGVCSLLIHKHENTTPSIIKSALLGTAEKQYIELTSPFGSNIKKEISKLHQGAGLVRCSEASSYLDDPPSILLWPSVAPFDLKTVFKNTENSFRVSVYINDEIDNLELSMASSVEEFVTISNLPENPDIGQYDLLITISHEDSYAGTHSHQILFIANNQSYSFRLSYEVVRAVGRILFICDELGDTNKYSLYGSLWNLLESAKKAGLIPTLFARDKLIHLRSVNLNNYEVIALINPFETEYRSYGIEDLESVQDYITKDGFYSGGAVILLPSITSDFLFLNSSLNPLNISYAPLGITSEVVDVSSQSHLLLTSPNIINNLFIPNPLNVTKSDDLENTIVDRLVFTDQRDDNGSLIISANSVEMFLSSPYLYSDVTTDYEENLQALEFGDNREFLENILASTIVDEIEFEYYLNTDETKINNLLTVRIKAKNYYKPLSGLTFYLSIETKTDTIFQYSTYEDYHNGEYLFSFIPKEHSIPPGEYRLAIRSPFGKTSWAIHLLARVSLGPIIVELSVVACIALLIVTKRKQVTK